MVKAYIFVGLISAILQPIVFYFLVRPDIITIIWGDLLLGASATAGIAVGAVLGLVIMRKIAGGSPEVVRGFLTRFMGALIAGVTSALAIYLPVAIESGALPTFSFDWWIIMEAPGFISAYIAYFIVNFLVQPVVPLTISPVKRNNRRM